MEIPGKEIAQLCQALQREMSRIPVNEGVLVIRLQALQDKLPETVRVWIAVEETRCNLQVFFKRGRQTAMQSSPLRPDRDLTEGRPYPKALAFLATYVEEQFEDGSGYIHKNKHSALRGQIFPATKVRWGVAKVRASYPTWYERLLTLDLER